MEWGYIFSCRLSSFLFARWYHYRPSWVWFLWCHADRQRWPFPFVLTRGPFAEQACSWTCSRSSLSTELTEDPESCMVLTWIWNNKKGVDGKMLSLLCWSAWFNVNRSLEDESMLHFFQWHQAYPEPFRNLFPLQHFPRTPQWSWCAPRPDDRFSPSITSWSDAEPPQLPPEMKKRWHHTFSEKNNLKFICDIILSELMVICEG